VSLAGVNHPKSAVENVRLCEISRLLLPCQEGGLGKLSKEELIELRHYIKERLIPDECTFTLGNEDEAALLRAITEADREDLADGDDVIQKIS
jgi:hypothetical protein